MIGRQYKAHKDNVIDLFDNYKIQRGDFNDGVNIKFLESRVRSLKNCKFTLAVAGEVKAGKSTFINALLGKVILPSDVLQASSAIVEIFKSETSFLKVRYADGKRESLPEDFVTSDTVIAHERLHEICKIHDEYREIPTTLIDDWIIASDRALIVDNAFVKQLEQHTGEYLQDKQSLIKQFVSERTKEKIPVEIEFGYPLKWEFDELRIVDSPGVNATGGVQKVSFRFFEEADAILFVHPIKPIESESFRKFVNKVISERSKETLFLVLTHAGLFSNDEVERLHAEAGRLYRNIIPENRILVVDSLAQIILSELYAGKSQDDIEESSEQKEDFLAKFEKKAKKEKTDLKFQLKKVSQFEKMFAAIDEFSMRAPNLQLKEILEKIKAGYEEQDNQYTEKVERLEKKKSNPQKFEQEINRINNALENYKLLTKQTKDDLKSNYSGRHSSWQKDIDALKVEYPERITGSDSIESARKHTVDALNAVQGKVNDFSRELTQKLEEALQDTGKAFKEEHQISIPKVDLKALEEKAKKNAYSEEKIGYWDKEPIWKFWKWFNRDVWVSTGTKKVFDDEKYLGEYRTKCNKEFYNIVNDLPNKSKEVLDLYLELFSKEMDSVIDGRQKALEAEKEKKLSNEQMITEIKDLDRKKKDIQPQKIRCIEVLEDIR